MKLTYRHGDRLTVTIASANGDRRWVLRCINAAIIGNMIGHISSGEGLRWWHAIGAISLVLHAINEWFWRKDRCA